MLATPAHDPALVVVAPRTVQGHCNGERPLSFGARPCCEVPTAAASTQLAFAWRSREHATERATAIAVSLKDARHARL